jgi:hypothetical protein
MNPMVLSLTETLCNIISKLLAEKLSLAVFFTLIYNKKACKMANVL